MTASPRHGLTEAQYATLDALDWRVLWRTVPRADGSCYVERWPTSEAPSAWFYIRRDGSCDEARMPPIATLANVAR